MSHHRQTAADDHREQQVFDGRACRRGIDVEQERDGRRQPPHSPRGIRTGRPRTSPRGTPPPQRPPTNPSAATPKTAPTRPRLHRRYPPPARRSACRYVPSPAAAPSARSTRSSGRAPRRPNRSAATPSAVAADNRTACRNTGDVHVRWPRITSTAASTSRSGRGGGIHRTVTRRLHEVAVKTVARRPLRPGHRCRRGIDPGRAYSASRRAVWLWLAIASRNSAAGDSSNATASSPPPRAPSVAVIRSGSR